VGRPNVGNKEELLKMLGDIVDRNWLTNDGPLVREFEDKVAKLHDVQYCVAICNGTIALEIALRALGLEGEVIVPSYTFVATAHALSWQGITPVFADINPDTHNLDPEAVRRMITPNTTGIIGVHLWGRPAPIDQLAAIASEFNLKVIYDAAHAFGTSANGQKIGAFGECEVLSFHATKVLNSFEGGAILTNNLELAQTARLMRNFGFAGFDNVIHPGTNGKLTEVCAAMGLINLRYFDSFVESNRKTYSEYSNSLQKVPGTKLLQYDLNNNPNYQYVVVEIEEGIEARDRVIKALHAENVLARKYFWPGCHGMNTYKAIYPHAGMLLPNSTRIAERVIVLPNGASLPEGAESCISDIIKIELGH
jgi:dTDP-4-amino-4,6-dideoxygalactose transaminase